jgi:hypothetical protein
MVTEGYFAVRFFMPFQGFTGTPLPGSVDACNAYRQLAIEFIEARNQRIDAAEAAGWAPQAHLDP